MSVTKAEIAKETRKDQYFRYQILCSPVLSLKLEWKGTIAYFND